MSVVKSVWSSEGSRECGEQEDTEREGRRIILLYYLEGIISGKKSGSMRMGRTEEKTDLIIAVTLDSLGHFFLPIPMCHPHLSLESSFPIPDNMFFPPGIRGMKTGSFWFHSTRQEVTKLH